MKRAFDPSMHQNKQTEMWAQHYQELYSRENIVTDATAMGTPILCVDTPSTLEDFHEAIGHLACGKSPGKDCIPTEIIKVRKNTALLSHLYQLLLQCWEEVFVP